MLPFHSGGFKSPDISYRWFGAATSISHLFFICTSSKNVASLSIFMCCLDQKKRQLTYAPDAHNLSEKCRVSSCSDPSLSHRAYQNTTWAWHAGQRGGEYMLALSLSLTDSQPIRHSDWCQATRPAPPVVHRHHTYTQTPTKTSFTKLPGCIKTASQYFQLLSLNVRV